MIVLRVASDGDKLALVRAETWLREHHPDNSSRWQLGHRGAGLHADA